MKVIGAGFGRTGTLSLKAALEQLGFGPCYHMLEVFQNPEHAKLWKAAHDGQLDNWETLLGGYQAMDGPAADLMLLFETMRTILDQMRDRERALEIFRQHYAAVQESIPADRLLVYEVKQGWEPLCEFLEVDVPDEPFPHLNDSETFTQMVEDLQGRQTGEPT